MNYGVEDVQYTESDTDETFSLSKHSLYLQRLVKD